MTDLVNSVQNTVEKSIVETYENLKALVASTTDYAKINEASLALTLLTYKSLPGQDTYTYRRAGNFKEALESNEHVFYVAVSFDVDLEDLGASSKIRNALLSYILTSHTSSELTIPAVLGDENGVKWRSTFIIFPEMTSNPGLSDIVQGLSGNKRTYNVLIRYNFFDYKFFNKS